MTVSSRPPTKDMQGRHQPDAEAAMAAKVSAKLDGCANYLVFNDYYKIDKLKLVKAITCQQHLVCPFCANRRAIKMMTGYVEKVGQVLEEKPNLKPAMITLTVKNGHDLAERFDHLNKAMRRLIDRRRDSLKKGRGSSEWMKIDGAAYSYEFTYSDETGWHPHVHMVALLSSKIAIEYLSEEWKEVTGDSFIVDVRLIRSKSLEEGSGSKLLGGLAEVMKYALKFSGLEPDKVWHAYMTLRGKRLIGSIGSLWGVKVPEGLLDEPLEDEPFRELFFTYSTSYNQYQIKTAKENGITPVDISFAVSDIRRRDDERLAKKVKPKRRKRWEPSD